MNRIKTKAYLEVTQAREWYESGNEEISSYCI